MKMQQLTEQESSFAAKHHRLVIRYLSRKGLSEDEYYDIIIFGYLNSVKKYFQREELRQQYSFAEMAWSAMDSCFSDYEGAKRSVYVSEERIAGAKDNLEKALSNVRIREILESFEQSEREIACLLIEGLSQSEICRQLGLTAGQLRNLMNQIQIKTLNSPLMRAA